MPDPTNRTRRWSLGGCAAGFFILATLLTTNLYAQKLSPFLPSLNGGAEKQNLPQPHPTNLVSGWWHFFDVEGEQLHERIKATEASLNSLLLDLPENNVARAQAFVDLLRANLRALPDARQKKAADLPPPPAYAEQYTPTALLALASRLQDTNTQLAIEKIDVEITESQLSETIRRDDTQTAAYLKLATSDPTRALTGLQIMSERLEVLVGQERLRLVEARLGALRSKSEQLTAELDVAHNRLGATDSSLATLELARADSQLALNTARAWVIKERANAASVPDDSQKDKATAQFRLQRVIRAQISEALATAHLIQLETQLAVSELLLARGIDNQTVAKKVSSAREQLRSIEKEVVGWVSASERERRRASANSGSQDSPQSLPSYLMSLNRERVTLAQDSLAAIRQLTDQIAQSPLAIQLVDRQLLNRDGLFKRWLSYAWLAVGRGWSGASNWAKVSLFTIGDTPVTAFGLLRIAVILTLAWWMSYWTRRMLERLGSRSDPSNLAAFYTIGRLSHYVIILLGVLIGLSSIGMDFSNFALVAGALAIGIGFGLQAIVNNFISGLILLFERSLKVGDFIDLGNNIAGEVKAINVRSTQIKTNENIDIVVPNSEFMNSNVINWTLQEPFRRVHYPFRVAFNADKDVVRKAGMEAMEKVSHTLSGIPGKNPQVWLVGFGENGYNFELVVWLTPSAVKRPQAVRAAYYWELESAIQKYEIEIPVPQRDLMLRGGFGPLTDPSDLPPND